MLTTSLNPREFARLTAAAISGLMAGTVLSGCGDAKTETAAPATTDTTNVSTADAAEMHACKGLNGCEGQGAGDHNTCAGQGGCASVMMHHECKGHNECKGQGGCGEMPGMNACKGQGGCAVPIKDEEAWKKAREKFEEDMKADGKEVGPAPA